MNASCYFADERRKMTSFPHPLPIPLISLLMCAHCNMYITFTDCLNPNSRMLDLPASPWRICERTAPFADKIVAAKALPALIRIGGFLMIDLIK